VAIRKFYIGSFGPFLYDDANLVNDPDGDFAGMTQRALTTDGQLTVQTVPVDTDEVRRYGDDAEVLLATINSIVTYKGAVVVHEGNVVTS